MLTWNDAYATGITDIDEQHKRLFGVINEFGAAVDRGEGEMKIGKTMKFLAHYAKVHFNFEEICMAKYRCPVALQNKKAHSSFLESYKKYTDRLAVEGCTEKLLREVQRMCEDWLADHICKIDTHLKGCVSKAGADGKRE
ncbi:MAG: hemerythrin family protein [Candidatus Omnitrophica bacterium]|nr:hemerythrin family protein [Candidatus Omnitrophota bacterium]